MPVTDGLGFTVYVEALLARLRRQLTEPKALEPTLVVGVFGPWGCGKSTLLQMVHDRIEAEAEGFAPQSLTLPIWFNPWRFETEDHLIIPLLKTTQQRLLSWQTVRERGVLGQATRPAASGPFAGLLRKALRQPSPPTPANWLKRKAELLGQSAVALAYGLKGELHLPLVGKVAFSPKDALDEERRRWEKLQQGEPNPLDDLQSLYYDLHRYLRELTGRDDTQREEQGERLNLVFLIDDLDRCLPEKAVQVLEAIKLFLEVEGCAFLLALDDEVIERGIAHRYRAYQPDTLRAFDSIAHSLHPDRYRSFTERRAVEESSPISGSEYLEKIVHLPFRIPAPTPLQVRRFLTVNFPALFAIQRPPAQVAEGRRAVPDAAARASGVVATDELSVATGEETRLLDLFEAAAPPVPRKLIRAAELLAFLQSVARERRVAYEPLTLARLVLLQLFAPDLYRFGRRNPRFLEAMERWLKEKGVGRWRSDRLLDELEEDRRALLRAPGPVEATPPRAALPDAGTAPSEVIRPEEAYFIEKTELPLLRLLRSSLSNRSGFDPRSLLDLASPCDARLGRYFSLIEEAAPPPAAIGELASELPGGEVQDVEGFLNDLFSDRAEAWLNAVNREELQGRTLGERTFTLVKERLTQRRVRERSWPPVGWIETLAERLTRQQLRELVAVSQVLERLETQARAGSVEAGRELGRLLTAVCRHHNPPHQPFAIPVRPAELGMESLDLAEADLRFTYLRGLEVPAQLPSTPDALDGANLEDTDLGAVPTALLGRLQLAGSRLLGAKGLPPRMAAESALVRISDGTAMVARPSALSPSRCLAALPDGRVVSGSFEAILRVWDVGSERVVAELKGHEGGVESVAVLPDGRVVSGGDGVLRVWDVGSGRVVVELKGYEGGVRSLAVLPDGRVVSGGIDGVLRVWDIGSERVVAELEGHEGGFGASRYCRTAGW